jgi:hypothetical protein
LVVVDAVDASDQISLSFVLHRRRGWPRSSSRLIHAASFLPLQREVDRLLLLLLLLLLLGIILDYLLPLELHAARRLNIFGRRSCRLVLLVVAAESICMLSQPAERPLDAAVVLPILAT